MTLGATPAVCPTVTPWDRRRVSLVGVPVGNPRKAADHLVDLHLGSNSASWHSSQRVVG